jgi:hypothetical protein
LAQLDFYHAVPSTPAITDPIALDLLRVIRSHYRYARQGIRAGLARDMVLLSPTQLGRTAFYERFAALRRAGLIELDGKRWRPVYYSTERNRAA